MIDSSLDDKFLEFEKKNNLFHLKDKNGVFIWDIIRFDIYISLLWTPDTSIKQKKK